VEDGRLREVDPESDAAEDAEGWLSMKTPSTQDPNGAGFSWLDALLCELALGRLEGGEKRMLEAMIENDPSIQAKFEQIKALYAKEATEAEDDELSDEAIDRLAALWRPLTPWVLRGKTISLKTPATMVRVIPFSIHHSAPAVGAAKLKAAAKPSPAVELAVRRFAPRRSVFPLTARVVIHCGDLPVRDDRWSVTLVAEGGRREAVISSTEACWHERRACVPEETGRDVRHVWADFEVGALLARLDCPEPAMVIDVGYTFCAIDGTDWQSGDIFRVAGPAWFSATEERIQDDLDCWKADAASAEPVLAALRNALEAAGWEPERIVRFTDAVSGCRRPLREPVRRAALLYALGCDAAVLEVVEQTRGLLPGPDSPTHVLEHLARERCGAYGGIPAV
jgi:hypothetical protein